VDTCALLLLLLLLLLLRLLQGLLLLLLLLGLLLLQWCTHFTSIPLLLLLLLLLLKDKLITVPILLLLLLKQHWLLLQLSINPYMQYTRLRTPQHNRQHAEPCCTLRCMATSHQHTHLRQAVALRHNTCCSAHVITQQHFRIGRWRGFDICQL
jgi:hypothetical protein